MVKKGAEIKKSGGKIFKIIGFILGLIGIVLCWIPILNIPIIITSIIGLVFSVVALKKSEKKKLAFAGLLLNVLAICIGVFTLIIVGGFLWLLFGTGGGLGSASAGNLSFTNYSIGEKISSGNMSVTVLSADKSSQIMNNQNQLIPVETTCYFLSVKLIIENGNPETITMTGDPFAVIDGQGRIFSASSDAERYYPNSIGTDTQFQPGVLFNGIKIFEVPKDSTGLKLKMMLTETEGAYVSLD